MKTQSMRCGYLETQITLDHLEKPRPCCQFQGTIPVENYKNDAKKYVDRLADGIRIKECQMCWKAEHLGIISLRQQYNDSKNINDNDISQANVNIEALDIRINNKCNLACTMCHAPASSLWGSLVNESKPIEIDAPTLEYVKKIEKDLVNISLQGGEPFYGNEYKEFINSLQYKFQVELEVFTNLITANKNDLLQWDREFKNFKVNVSVDGMKDRYTQIRWLTSWEKFHKKSTEILPYMKDVRFFYTVQNITIEYIKNFIKWRNCYVPNAGIVFSVLQNPTALSLEYSSAEQLANSIKSIEFAINDGLAGDKYTEMSLRNILTVLKNIKVDPDKVKKQNQYLEWVDSLRKNYTSKKQ